MNTADAGESLYLSASNPHAPSHAASKLIEVLSSVEYWHDRAVHFERETENLKIEIQKLTERIRTIGTTL